MTSTINQLLGQAYSLAEAGKIDDAAKTLDVLVRTAPQTVEAWEFYFQICNTRENRDQLAKRVSTSPAIDPADKEEILDYYHYLLQERQEKVAKQGQARTGQFKLYLIPMGLAFLLGVLWFGKIYLHGDLMGAFIIVGVFFLGIHLLWKVSQRGYLPRRSSSRQYAQTIERQKIISRKKQRRKTQS